MRETAARHGFTDLVAPVRPSGKPQMIKDPIDGYAHTTRPDGLPVDPWLRVHMRAGATIVDVAHYRPTRARWSSGGRGPACRSTGPGRRRYRAPCPRSTAT